MLAPLPRQRPEIDWPTIEARLESAGWRLDDPALPKAPAYSKLREAIKELEPFATALRMAQSGKEFSAEELLNELDREGISEEEEFSDPEQLHKMLLEWLLYTETIKYNGEDKKFSKKR